MPAGRPSDYSPELAEKILIKLERGDSLRKICRAKNMPDRTTVNRWRRKNEEFHIQYERAWVYGMEARADEIEEIAETATPEDVQVAKLRCDNAKWLMARIGKNRFGDRQTVEHEAASGFSFTINPPKDES